MRVKGNDPPIHADKIPHLAFEFPKTSINSPLLTGSLANNISSQLIHIVYVIGITLYIVLL